MNGQAESEAKRKKRKRKATKDLALLSFGEDEGLKELTASSGGMTSMHDVVKQDG